MLLIDFRLLLLLCCMGVATCAFAANVNLYVSTGGSATGNGSKGHPFQTLQQARDAIRALKAKKGLPAGGITVRVAGGVYQLTDSFALTNEDSGSEKSPIRYLAEGNEPVRLVGGRMVDDWEKVSDPAILARLPEAARAQVRQVDLKALGITDLGKLRVRGFNRALAPAHLELFFNDQRMTLARWPNTGAYTKITGFLEPMSSEWGSTQGKLEAGFTYAGDRPKQWAPNNDLWVYGFWAYDWASSYEHVASIDTEKNSIKTDAPYGLYYFTSGQRLYFLNVLEELDQPGEYYLEHNTGILYFWPPADMTKGQALVSLLESPMVSMRDVSDVSISGITLEATRGSGITITGGSRNTIGTCTLRHIGNVAVTIDGGSNHRVTGCTIYDTGDGGISVTGGDRRTLTPCGHSIDNNHIHHIGQWDQVYQPAILVNGVGVHIAHNVIHDGPHCGILLTGNDHLIEFNEIYRVCQDTGDVGAFYMGRDYSQQGNIIRYNFFHDIGGVGMGSMGVYLDDNTSGVTVFGNIFYHATRAVMVGGGRDNLIENNVFVECKPALQIDGRGLDPNPVWQNMTYQTMKSSLEAMHYLQPPYSTRYPKLLELQSYLAKPGGVPPEGNVVRYNICLGGSWTEIGWFATPAMIDMHDNLINQDPHFIDPATMNFQLRADSPAFALGFKRIPTEQIGLTRGAVGNREVGKKLP